MWSVSCQCGNVGPWFAFATFHGRDLPANQWHCKACDRAWQIDHGTIRIIRAPAQLRAARSLPEVNHV